MEKKVKRRINKKALIVIILILYLIIMIFYYVYKMPIKNIIINGNNLLNDSEIISSVGLNDYPNLFKVSTKKIEKKLEKLDLVISADVDKNLFGTIYIDIEEAQILFLNKTNNKLVLSNKKEISEISYSGIPTLINYVPSDIYTNLIEQMSKIDGEIIALISEIEYNPDVKEDITINDNRFILKMNDGNLVYIDIVNFTNLKMYKTIYSNLETSGIIHLDNVYADADTIIFTPFDKINEGESDELSE
ncbi:MAG: FtsQ-type POTRA domain-containing protein [Bacilli bacterium]